MRVSELPASPSRSVLTIGIAPPTAASKLSATWFFSASAASATPWRASSALLAVTTDLPAVSAAVTARLRRIARPADQFDEDVDAGIGRERHRVGDPAQLLEVDAALLGARARAHRDDVDRPAAAGEQRLALLGDEPHHGGADRAEPGNTDLQRFGHRAPSDLA